MQLSSKAIPQNIIDYLQTINIQNPRYSPRFVRAHITQGELLDRNQPAEPLGGIPFQVNPPIEIGDEVRKVFEYFQQDQIVNLVHTGIYIGHGLVISKYQSGQDATRGKIALESQSCWPGYEINRKGSGLAARRAYESLLEYEQYANRFAFDLLTDNCQHFTQRCLQLF